ncbi:MAG: N-6 DNA methylase, partial [Sphingobacteriia bacterium]
NLAIRGIEANIAWGDTLLNEQHRDLKADYIMANPPFNISDWYAERLKQDQRWKYGLPPAGNANYAWLQHILHHLSPTGTAGVVLANGSMTSNSSGEGDIRRAMIEDSVVDCMVALPNQLFYNTQIPVCLWFLARDRRNHKFRDRRNEILFIDARKLGTMVSRKHKELTEADIQHIAGTYHAWRNPDGRYTDTPGYCKAATLDEVRKNDYVLTPGRYVGAEETEVDEEAYEAQMQHLTQQLAAQMAEGERLNAKILENLKELGYGN